MSLLLSLVALVAAFLAPSTLAQSGPGWQIYNFCYLTQNTLTTSPYLMWSIYASGAMNISTQNITGFGSAFNQGYQVLGISGTREAYVQGKALQSNTILGLTPYLTYGANDNVINTTSPYLIKPHAVSFYLNGIAQYAAGPAVYPNMLKGSANVSINSFAEYREGDNADVSNSFAESDNPPNDGVANVITGGIQLVLSASGGMVSSYTCSNYARPTAPPANSAAAIAAYGTTLTWYFCYQFESGGFDVAAAQYLTSTTGSITTTGLLGAAPGGGATGYLAINVTGTRTFTYISNFPGVPGAVYTVSLTAIGSPLAPYFMFPTYRYGIYETDAQSSSGHYTYANNLLYPNFPQVDLYGIAFITNSSITDEWTYTTNGGKTTNTQVFMLYTDNSYIIYDTVYSLTPGYYIYPDPNFADSLVLQTQAQYVATGLTGAAWTTATCGYQYANAPSKFSFCYYIDNTNVAIPAAQRGVTSMYGTFQARTGLTRYGKPAMQIQGMTGIRTTYSTFSKSASSQSLVQIEQPNALFETFLYSLGYLVFTDNVLFTQPPWFSEAGLALTFADISNVTYLGYPATTTKYLNLYSTWSTTNNATSAGLYEGSLIDSGATNYYKGYTVSNFNYTNYIPGQLAQCNLLNNKVTMATQNYSFCWFRQSTAGYINSFSAVITAYTTPIYRNGRPGYVVQAMTGLRTYVDAFGVVASVTLSGLAGDGIATSFAGFQSPSFGINADNLIYDSFPYLDAEGILYQVNGPLGDFIRAPATQTANNGTWTGVSAGTGVALDSIGRLYYDETGAAPQNYYDESLYNITDLYNATGTLEEGIWEYILLTGLPANVKIIPDNGALANAGNILQSQCNAPTYQLFSFCYTLQQTLATSPYLPWTVYVTGTLNISMIATAYWVGGSGYKVVGATGTRTILYGGKNITNNIIGVAPVSKWNWNDNEINLAAPFLTNLHVISFQLDGVAHFPGGPIQGLVGGNQTYFSISNFTQTSEKTLGAIFNEDDHPLIGSVSSVTSQFDMRLYLAGTSVCPFTAPVPTYNAAALAAYNNVQKIAMCFSVTAAPGGYGDLPGGFYTIITQMVIYTTSYGQTTSGVTAYLILNGTGTRSYVYADGTNNTANIVVGGINAMLHAWPTYFIPGSIATYASSNLYYPNSAENLDALGINIVGDRDFLNQYEGDIHNNVARIYWSGASWTEQNLDIVSGYIYWVYSGAALFQPFQAGMDMNAFAQQCTAYYGGLSTWSFCYAIDGSAQTTPFVSYAYGLLQADGPQMRLNRTAYAVRGMTGVRTIVSNGVTTQNNIMNVQYLDEDVTGNTIFLTDNLFFPTGVPEVSILGIGFNMSQPALVAGGVTTGFSSLIISTDGLASGNALYEQAGGGTTAYVSSTKYQMSVAPYTAGSTTLGVSCNNVVTSVPAAPTLITYPFCYAMNGPDNYGYQISVSGSITVYSTAIPIGSLTAYAVANVSGSRQYTDGMGRSFTATITGLSQDWIAEQQGWTYDQLLYTTGSPVDAYGILYKFGGFINNNNPQAVTYDRVVRFYSDSSSPITEEYYNTNGSMWIPTFTKNHAQVSLGSGTTSTTCTSKLPANGYTGPAYTPPSSNNNNNSTGGGGSSGSGLSNGAIAGIVVGTCVGAFLFCVICFLLGYCTSGGKKSTESKPAYDSQIDQSRTGQSQVVELQTAESSRVGNGEVETA